MGDRANDRSRYGNQHRSKRLDERNGDGYRRERSRSRDREWRGDHHDDDRNWRRDRDATEDQGYMGERGAPPNECIMIKGLPSHTTEPALYAVLAAYGPQHIRLIANRDTGESKGFAFVEFHSIEYAQYFMTAFAGSCGDPNAPQLIVGNRAVTIEYARDSGKGGYPPRERHGSGQFGHYHQERERDHFDNDREEKRVVKSDWLCHSCGCQNFARRSECYRCSLPRNEHSVVINSPDSFADAAMISPTPTTMLLVKGLSPYTTEEQVLEVFRQFAVVTSVRIVRDRLTGLSKGSAFVELPTVDYAVHTLQQASATHLLIDNTPVKISYGKESAAASVTNIPGPSIPSNPYAAAALQAAQWSANNGYAMMKPPIPPPPMSMPSSFPLPTPVATMAMGGVKQKPRWPPRFETNGAAYMFQPQTGCFFEPLSEYYYCPKSKLYYCAVKGIYYRAVGPSSGAGFLGDDAQFVRFLPPLPSGTDDGSGQSKQTNELESLGKGDKGRKPVVLSMSFGASKSKASSSKSAKKESSPPVIVTPAEAAGIGSASALKKAAVAQAIAKWEDVKKKDSSDESKQTSVESTKDSNVPAVGQRDSNSELKAAIDSEQETAKKVTPSVATPATAVTVPTPPAQPVCLLCRRGFPSMELLQRHEKESKLHAENLAKKVIEDLKNGGQVDIPVPASAQTMETVYRDRASERRAIFGQSRNPEPIRKRSRSRSRSRSRDRSYRRAVTMMEESSSMHAQPAATSTTTVADDLANPGNQMLRKLGWQEGSGLGKDGSGIKDPVSLKAQDAGSKTGVGSTPSSIPPLEYGDGRAYKDSLLRAARARYEQVDQK